MTIYIINVILTLTFMYAANRSMLRTEDDYGNTYKRPERKWILLTTLVWVLICACRGFTGSDSAAYNNIYRIAFLSNDSALNFATSRRDIVFYYLFFIISKATNGNWVMGCAFFGFLTYFPILYLIKEKSPNLVISSLLYIFQMSYYFGFNGMKQAVSVGLCLIAYTVYLSERKYLKYLLLMLIAYGFHSSAIIILPFHFISKMRYKSWILKITLITMALGALFVLQRWSVVISGLEFLGQDKMVQDYSTLYSERGSTLLRTIVAFALPVLGATQYQRTKEKYEDIDGYLIMSFIGGIIMLYSMQTVVFSQLAEYFSVLNIILLPKVLDSMDNRNKQSITGVIMILYLVYMIMLLLHGDGRYYPYVPVWKTNYSLF